MTTKQAIEKWIKENDYAKEFKKITNTIQNDVLVKLAHTLHSEGIINFFIETQFLNEECETFYTVIVYLKLTKNNYLVTYDTEYYTFAESLEDLVDELAELDERIGKEFAKFRKK